MVWHARRELPSGPRISIAVPGGFSYGDYLRSGAMAARSPVMRAVVDAADAGRRWCSASATASRSSPRTGLLPGALMRNAGLNFICRDVPLTVENSQSLFTSRYDQAANRSASRSPITTATGLADAARRSTGWRAKAAWRSRYAAHGQRLGPRHRRHVNEVGNASA